MISNKVRRLMRVYFLGYKHISMASYYAIQNFDMVTLHAIEYTTTLPPSHIAYIPKRQTIDITINEIPNHFYTLDEYVNKRLLGDHNDTT